MMLLFTSVAFENYELSIYEPERMRMRMTEGLFDMKMKMIFITFSFQNYELLLHCPCQNTMLLFTSVAFENYELSIYEPERMRMRMTEGLFDMKMKMIFITFSFQNYELLLHCPCVLT